ncbi:SMI1/KNR4 family protein [Thermobifida halotolerans]|uniref:hypothetical protein n=1 Tax=Thermobifida halotolerans TaxID=483545 RepID=UPI0012F5047A|nr:hypothetical protein [Thermobifida halotolerans]
MSLPRGRVVAVSSGPPFGGHMDAFSWEPPTPQQVVAALRSAAEASDGGVVLLPGISDSAMDAWEAPVPEDIRATAREIGGFAPVGWNGKPDLFEAFGFENEFNAEPDHRCGPPGTFRVLHTNGLAEAYYVDVDPETGEWHGVFSLWDSIDATFEAPSLPQWLCHLADGIRRSAGAVRAGCYRRLEEAFFHWFRATAPESGNAEAFRDWAEREFVRLVPGKGVIDAPAARASADPVLAEVGAQLPDCASVIDLRGINAHTSIETIDSPGMGIDAGFRRFHHGRILAAVPWD